MGRFINADAFLTTNLAAKNINLFAYCCNNPIIYIDGNGYARTHFEALSYDDQTSTNSLKQWEAVGVEYKSNGPGKGGQIVNSYLIRGGEDITAYVLGIMQHPLYQDDIGGTLEGVYFEWIIHNALYDVGAFLQIESIKKKAADLDFGNTIYNDEHGPFNIASAIMWGLYYIAFPDQAQKDLQTYLLK